MSTTISNGTNTLTPRLVSGWKHTRESRSIVHDILGTSAPAVTLRPAALRSGTLLVVVGTDDNLVASMEGMFSAGDVLTIASTERPLVDMSFVAVGDVTVTLDDETRTVWTIEVDFQEVAA